MGRATARFAAPRRTRVGDCRQWRRLRLSNFATVGKVRVALLRLLETVTGLYYVPELPAGELERIRVAAIAATKPLELVNLLPELDLAETDDELLMPTAARR